MIRMKVLNIDKLNIYQVLNFMFKIKTKTAPHIFENQFTEVHQPYSTRFIQNSFVENQLVYSSGSGMNNKNLWNAKLALKNQ